MLGRLLKRRRSSAPEAGPQICMVAFGSVDAPSPASIRDAWTELFPDILLELMRGDDSAPGFVVGGRAVMCVPVPFPIPSADIEWAARRSWMWPEAEREMARQRSHMLLATTADGDPVEAAMAATRVAAAACRAGDGVGVYWGSGGQVHKPQFVIDTITDLDPAVPIWVGLVISRDDSSGLYTLSTLGLAALGHKEFEILDTRMEPDDLAGTAYDLVAYVVSNGPVLADGNTFGPTAEDKWRVEHTGSALRKGEQVIRLHVP